MRPDREERWAFLDPLDLVEHQGPVDYLEIMVSRVSLVSLDLLGPTVNQVHRETQDSQVT